MPVPRSWMHLKPVTIDFETYYDDDYSLKKMTTEEYVRDPRFQIMGAGVTLHDKTSYWVTGTHHEIRARLQALIDFDTVCYSNHNNSGFDSLVMTQHLDLHPRAWACTLANGRALVGARSQKGLGLDALAQHYGLDGKTMGLEAVKGLRREELTPELNKILGDYAINDAQLAHEIFLKQVPDMPADELEIVDLFCRMFAYPRVLIDGPLCDVLIQQEMAATQELIDRTGLTRKELNANKPDAYVARLRELGVEPAIKTSPTTGKEVYAFAKTDPFMEDMLLHDDERVVDLIAARLAIKSSITRSRLARLSDIAKRGPLPVPLVYGRAVTHRVGGSGKINLQNMSRPAGYAHGKANKFSLIYTPDGYAPVVAHKSDPEDSGKDMVAVVPVDSFKVLTRVFADRDYVPIKAMARSNVKTYYSKDCHVAGVRDVILAPDGYTFSVADSSNIELRVAHTLAGQMDSVERLRAGADMYSLFASDLYGREISKKDKIERLHGKVSMLQLQYQSGWRAFQKACRTMGGLKLDNQTCMNTVDLYRGRFHCLPAFWRICQQAIEAMYTGQHMVLDMWGLLHTEQNAIILPNGLKLIYHGLCRRRVEKLDPQTGEMTYREAWMYRDKENGMWKFLYGGSLFENICQALARIIVFEQMLDIERTLGFPASLRRDIGVVLTVHDENIFLQETAQAKNTLEYMLYRMSLPPTWWPELPVAAEGDIATRYAVAK